MSDLPKRSWGIVDDEFRRLCFCDVLPRICHASTGTFVLIMSDRKRRNKRILIVVTSAIAGLSAILLQVIPWLMPLLSDNNNKDAAAITTTTTKPALTIKPVPVRPVISAFVTTPEQCPAPPNPIPPDKPIRICDIPKTAVYELGPEAMRMQLTNVEAFRNPLTGVELVQMSMTNETSEEFGKFTATQVGKQVAFVRSGTVVWGPKISAPIDGQVLQLSGELTPEQAKGIAKMLKEAT